MAESCAVHLARHSTSRRCVPSFRSLHQRVHGQPLVYLDNAATSQKPRAVLDALRRYYEHDNANVHRGVHALSERATEAYEGAREKVRAFLNAASIDAKSSSRATRPRASTSSRARGATRTSAPATKSSSPRWSTTRTSCRGSSCARASGATLVVAPMDDHGELLMDEFDRSADGRTKIVAVVAHVECARHDQSRRGDRASAPSAPAPTVLIDGSQAAYHMPVDVQALGADFYVCTGHKLYGPTGIGVLYGREACSTRCRRSSAAAT